MGHSWKRHMIFGFEECHATEQIIVGLTLLLQRGREWFHEAPVSILSADVKGAFDTLCIDTVIQSCMYWQIPGDLVKALIEETLDLMATATVHGIDTNRQFPFNRCAKQGGKEAPWEWNLVMRHALDLCRDKWTRSGLGINMPVVGPVMYVVWADNVYFISHHALEVQHMAQDFTNVLQSFRLQWKPESLEYLSTDPGSPKTLTLWQEHECLEVPQVEVMEVLGAKIARDGNTLTSMRHRLGRATACFWKYSDALCEKSLSLHKRLSEFEKRVHGTALYGAGAWTWSQTMYTELYRWENEVLRRIAQFRRAPDKAYFKHIQHSTQRVRKIFHGQRNVSICTKVLDVLHRTAGSSFAKLSCETSLDMVGMPGNSMEQIIDT
eukprot:12417512-Karenia_brevis.AAC.1